LRGHLDEPRLLAAVDLIRRTGASSFQIRYSDDEQPIVWFVVSTHVVDGHEVHEVDASLDPVRAALRLCERLVDGGRCAHCGRPAGLEPDSIDTMPADDLICWYQYDPELETFRRACEGSTSSAGGPR
jgi:hypothetical protein